MTIYGLANTSEDNGSPQQTILAVSLSKEELRAFDEKAASASTSTASADQISTVALKSFFNLADFAAVNGNSTTEKPSAELCLFYERLRGQIVNGISSYSLHPSSGSFLVSSASQLHVFQVGWHWWMILEALWSKVFHCWNFKLLKKEEF